MENNMPIAIVSTLTELAKYPYLNVTLVITKHMVECWCRPETSLGEWVRNLCEFGSIAAPVKGCATVFASRGIDHEKHGPCSLATSLLPEEVFALWCECMGTA